MAFLCSIRLLGKALLAVLLTVNSNQLVVAKNPLSTKNHFGAVHFERNTLSFQPSDNHIQILKWDFDDGDADPSTGVSEINLTEGPATLTANTSTEPVFLDIAGYGKSLYYTSWNQTGVFYEIQFNALGYQDLLLSFEHRSTESGPSSFRIEYSTDDGDTFEVLHNSTETSNEYSSATFDLSALVALNGLADVRIRITPLAPASSGQGRFYLDNVVLEAHPIQAEKLEIIQINNNQHPINGQSFDVVVQAQTLDGVPARVLNATNVSVSIQAGSGNITAGGSATIPANALSHTIPVTFAPAETGVVFQVSAVDDDLASALSEPLSIIEPEPAGPVLSLTATVMGESTIDVGWTRDIPSSDGVILIARESEPIQLSPENGVHYMPDQAFGNGSDLGNGHFVVYAGDGNNATISGLTPNAEYYFAAFTYNGENGTQNYHPGSLSASEFTCVKPEVLSSNIDFNSVTTNSLQLTWQSGSGQWHYVVMNSSDQFDAPVDGAEPGMVNAQWANSGEQIVYFGPESEVSITGVSPTTTYYFRIYETNCSGEQLKYSSSFTAFSYTTAQFFEGFDNCALPGWNNILISGNSWNCSDGAVKASGSGAETWLISPAINFSLIDHEMLSFYSRTLGADEGEPYPQLKVLFSDLYPGNGNPSLEAYQWEELPFNPSPANSGAWTFSGYIDLSEKTATHGYLAFRYRSGAGAVADWQIDDVLIENRPCEAPSLQAANVVVSGLTTTSANLSWTNGNGFARIVSMVNAEEITHPPANGESHQANPNFGSGASPGNEHFIVYHGTGNSVQVTGLEAGENYAIKVYEYTRCAAEGFEYYYSTANSGGNPVTFATHDPALSEVLVKDDFSYPSNIPYNNYQGNSLTTGNSIEVGQFVLKDKGGDDRPTQLTQIRFAVANPQVLRKVALFDGNSTIQETAASSFVNFTGLDIRVEDGQEKEFSLRASFAASVVDNTQVQFTTTSYTGGDETEFSPLNPIVNHGAQTSVEGNDNRIAVTADRLSFVTVPNIGYVNVPFTAEVHAVDELGNVDVDATGEISLNHSGTGILAGGEPRMMSGGEVFFPGLSYDKQEEIDLLTISPYAIEATRENIPFNNVLALYDFTGYHLGNDGLAAPTWQSSGIEVSEFSLGSNLGPLSIPAHDAFSCRGFSSSVAAPTNHYYLEFTFTPEGQNLFDVASLQFAARRSGQGPKNLAVRSNREGNFSEDINPVIIAVEENFATYNIPLSGYGDLSEPVTFRIYGYNSGSANGSLRIDDLVIFGTLHDETLPSFHEGYPFTDLMTTTSFELYLSTDEGSLLHYLLLDSEAAFPSSLEVINNATGTFQVVEKDTEYSLTIQELTSSQAYNLFMVLEDESGNYAEEPILLESIVTANDNSDVANPSSPIGGGSIASIRTDAEEMMEIFAFRVSDNGAEAPENDGLPTVINTLTIVQGLNNTASWAATIAGVSLRNRETNELITWQDTVIADGLIQFIFNENDFVIPANETVELALSVWLHPSVNDNEQLQFQLPDGAENPDRWMAYPENSSQFSEEFSSAIVSGLFIVDVQATRLSFSDYPGDIVPGEGFSLRVSATDELGNIDYDIDDETITLSKASGAGTLAVHQSSEEQLSKQTALGEAFWDNSLDYSGAADFFSIQAEINSATLSGVFESGLISAGGSDLIIGEGEIFRVQGSLPVTGNVQIAEGGELIMNPGSELRLTGNFNCNGQFTDNGGTLHFNGIESQSITAASILRIHNLTIAASSSVPNEADIELVNTLKLHENAVFDADGESGDREFILLSTADNTARIAAVESGATLEGNITLQRFIRHRGNAGWHFLTTPLREQTVANWQDNLRIQGLDNFHPGAAKVLFHYQEPVGTNTSDGSEGWTPITTHQTSISGEGLRMYIFNSAFRNGSLVIDNKGEPFVGDGLSANGAFQAPLSFTPTAYDGGGWNLIANPYPCEIDWNQVEFSGGVNNALYIWDADNRRYSAFVNGASINNGPQYIASGRSFFVKATQPDQHITFRESVKASGQGNTFNRKSLPSDHLSIQLTTLGGISDETVIRFEEQASEDFDPQWDAYKLKSYVNLGSKTSNGDVLAINSLPSLRAGISKIPLEIDLAEADGFYLSFSHGNISGDLPNIYLLDKSLQKISRVDEGAAFYFRARDEEREALKDRFEIIFASPIHFYLKGDTALFDKEAIVQVKADPFRDVAHVKAALQWDAKTLAFLDVEDTRFDSATFDFSEANAGQLTFDWNGEDGHTLEDGQPLFALRFRILANVEETTVSIAHSSLEARSADDIEFPAIYRHDGVVKIIRHGLLAGRVATETGHEIPGLTLQLKGENTGLTQTNASGEYRFDIYESSPYTLTVSDDSDSQNESVDLMDLISLQRFLNGQQRFESPFSTIAADADGSKSIDENDLAVLKNILLEKANPLNKAWVFIPRSFDVSRDPLGYPEEIEIDFAETQNLDLTAVKPGDVNLSYPHAEAITGKLNVRIQKVSAIEFAVEAVEGSDLHALRLVLNWNPESQGITGMRVGKAGGILEYHQPTPGKMIVLWEEGSGKPMHIRPGEALLHFAVETVEEENSLWLSPNDHENAAIDAQLRKLTIDASGSITHLENQAGFVVLQNYPNPVQDATVIGFYLPEPGKGKLEIYDVMGTHVHRHEADFSQGWNEIIWQKPDNLPSGIYLYSITAGKWSEVKKLTID